MDDQTPSAIDKDTWVRIGEVVVILFFGAGMIMWAAGVSFTAVNAERVNDRQDLMIQKNSDKIELNQKEASSLLFEINGRTIRIEEALKRMSN